MVSQCEIGSATQKSKGRGRLVSIVSYSRPSLMIIASRTRFHVERPWGRLAQCLNSFLNVKAVVAAFNQEKALVGAFSVITNLRMGLHLNLQWYNNSQHITLCQEPPADPPRSGGQPRVRDALQPHQAGSGSGESVVMVSYLCLTRKSAARGQSLRARTRSPH